MEEKGQRSVQTRFKEREKDAEEPKNDDKNEDIIPQGEEKAKLTAFDDSDVEYPSDYTEGEGIEVHNLSSSQKKQGKKDRKAEKERLFRESLRHDIDETLDPVQQLERAMERIAEKTSLKKKILVENSKFDPFGQGWDETGAKPNKKLKKNKENDPNKSILLPDGTIKPLLAPSLLAVAWSHVGRRGTNASKRILSTAKMSAPKLHTFIPPEYRGLSEKRLIRRARHDPILRGHLNKARERVASMTQRFKEKDAKVRDDLQKAGTLHYQNQPALMIPFRPHSDIPTSCMTISLKRNTLRVSISAIGGRHQALYKRGYRTNLIETSLRESIANGLLGVAYNHMNKISTQSPLYKLETDPKYLKPIRDSLLYLAKDVRIGFNQKQLATLPGGGWSNEHQDRQDSFLKNAVTILGEEQTQKQLLNALLETRRDVLSNGGVLSEIVHQGDNIAQKQKRKHEKYLQKQQKQQNEEGGEEDNIPQENFSHSFSNQDGQQNGQNGRINPNQPTNDTPWYKQHQVLNNNQRYQPLSTNMLDQVVEKMDEDTFQLLVAELTTKNNGKIPLDDQGKEISLIPDYGGTKKSSYNNRKDKRNDGKGDDGEGENNDELSEDSDIMKTTSQDQQIKEQKEDGGVDDDIPSTTSGGGIGVKSQFKPRFEEKTQKIQKTSTDLQNLPSFNEIQPKKYTKSDIINSFKLSAIDVMDAVANLPTYHQAQAITALAAGLPFDNLMPIPSPTITPIRTVALHNRDHTPLREVLSHTLSSGIIDADPSIRVFDPFCGSGTLVIESVFRFLGLPLQPLQRSFAFENWPIHDEYQYNAMMWEWRGRYQHIVKDFIKTFGITKFQTLQGDFQYLNSQNGGIIGNELSLRNNIGLQQQQQQQDKIEFPLFVGTDLRHKSITAAINNSNNAGVNYFTHFFQSDFQSVIYESKRLWLGHQQEIYQKRLEEQQENDKKTFNDDFFAQFSTSNNGEKNQNNSQENNQFSSSSSSSSLKNSPSSIQFQNSVLRPKKTLLSIDQAVDDLLGDTIPGIPSRKPTKTSLTPTTQAQLPLTKPYLKGYTMFSNIPWGVVDEKPHYNDRRDPSATRYANITQQEPVEDLYIRMGRTLYDNKDMFRDVFVLSAHQKFEKLTQIGAQRQQRDNERTIGTGERDKNKFGEDNDDKKDKKEETSLVKFENGVKIWKQPKSSHNGTLEWDTLSTFYNNGVKTHLLKLKM